MHILCGIGEKKRLEILRQVDCLNLIIAHETPNNGTIIHVVAIYNHPYFVSLHLINCHSCTNPELYTTTDTVTCVQCHICNTYN